ncbi:hypothetical protein QBC33DRAFT_510563 [Phialemonium atrogriseum]|uniref:Uncharacterized protein n=1 Tax=Phialemonium atrogriseum TaxID=1093897 RepID=A0AAJ0C9N8_9PEZI|nr:uncharacterized protein QBC33DRAFT_510563 [Phialemonium atrogriseum]KAK1772730.1 hypothetical protein QBC33DRAFT_510563 [Phialemonium atrogriseum]
MSHSYPYPNDDDDDYVRHRPASRHRRDYSPDYYSGGGGGGPAAPRAYASGAMPAPPLAPSPPPPGPQARLRHNDLRPLYPTSTNDRLAVPNSSRPRPRSTPPLNNNALVTTTTATTTNNRPPHRDRDSKSPLSRARHALQHTFTPSDSGLGAGVLGAIVGGLAAREASSAAASSGGRNHRSGGGSGSSHGHGQRESAALLSTIVGAAVGGLGANALEKRLEAGRERTRTEQERWEAAAAEGEW